MDRTFDPGRCTSREVTPSPPARAGGLLRAFTSARGPCGAALVPAPAKMELFAPRGQIGIQKEQHFQRSQSNLTKRWRRWRPPR